MVYVGQTTLYETFRDVMHILPPQYAKAVKMDEAQNLIQQRNKAN